VSELSKVRGSRVRNRLRYIGLVAAVGLLVAGCQGGEPQGIVSGASGTLPSASPTPVKPTLSISPASSTTPVRADRPVSVSLVNGKLNSVRLTDKAGKQVGGSVDATGTWRNTQPLSAGTSYTVTASAIGEDGEAVQQTSTFTTVKATRLVNTTLIPGDDWKVGVGMPVIVVFSQPVKNKDAALAALKVQSTPSVTGGWRWFSDTEAHYRPKDYWAPGTKVQVTASTSGTELAKGQWGKRTVTTKFEIGSDQRMTVNMAKHTMTFTRDGKTVRTMPVTTGKPGFSTRNGIKVVMDRESQVTMDAATTGIDSTDPDYYNLKVNWAMRLTWSGEYFHAAPWSVGSQGRANVSHGCTGLSTANAKWLYDNVQIGDVAVFSGGSRSLEQGNGYTDWNLPFSAYTAT